MTNPARDGGPETDHPHHPNRKTLRPCRAGTSARVRGGRGGRATKALCPSGWHVSEGEEPRRATTVGPPRIDDGTDPWREQGPEVGRVRVCTSRCGARAGNARRAATPRGARAAHGEQALEGEAQGRSGVSRAGRSREECRAGGSQTPYVAVDRGGSRGRHASRDRDCVVGSKKPRRGSRVRRARRQVRGTLRGSDASLRRRVKAQEGRRAASVARQATSYAGPQGVETPHGRTGTHTRSRTTRSVPSGRRTTPRKVGTRVARHASPGIPALTPLESQSDTRTSPSSGFVEPGGCESTLRAPFVFRACCVPITYGTLGRGARGPSSASCGSACCWGAAASGGAYVCLIMAPPRPAQRAGAWGTATASTRGRSEREEGLRRSRAGTRRGRSSPRTRPSGRAA